MQGREFLLKMIRTYFLLVTLITMVIYVAGTLTQPDTRFGYDVFILPHIYALAGVLPEVVMYSKHELSIKEMLVRKFIQLLLIELLVIGIIFGKKVLDLEYIGLLKTVSLCIVVVYILATIIEWIMDSVSAKRLTRELEIFQANNHDE